MTANSSKTAFKIIVDGDSCPVKDIILRISGETDIPVVLVTSTAHWTGRPTGEATVITVDNIPQAADIAISNQTAAGDIVVTEDYGLAAVVLAKRALPVSARGLVYSEKNIDRLLLQRHLDAKIRRGGGRTRGPKKFNEAARLRFEKALRTLIACKGLNPPEG